jgi:hypothetical protein
MAKLILNNIPFNITAFIKYNEDFSLPFEIFADGMFSYQYQKEKEG